jgi:hypothetical protein
MVEPLRHRQTKGAETDMPGLPPPRHIPTLPYRGDHADPALAARYRALGSMPAGTLGHALGAVARG